jgi:peroxiredoxin
MRRAIAAASLGSLVAIGTVASAEPPSPAQLAGLELNPYPRRITPPDFSLQTIDNQRMTLAGLRGRVVLLNFWATWCRECRPEMSAFEALHRKFAPHGLSIVGINAREPSGPVQQFARSLGLTFPLALDVDGAVAVQYGVIGLPTTFVLGRDGQAIGLAVGAREWASASAESIILLLLSDSP